MLFLMVDGLLFHAFRRYIDTWQRGDDRMALLIDSRIGEIGSDRFERNGVFAE